MNKCSVQVLFFAALRENSGLACHQLPLSQPVTVLQLIDQLATMSPRIAHALHDSPCLCAINQQLVPLDSWVQPGDEVALFPPVTGG